jgi:histone deacetylase 6
VLLPMAYEFAPSLVIVSCGFDAARGDPLGQCTITPEGYAHLLWPLMGAWKGLAESGRVK